MRSASWRTIAGASIALAWSVAIGCSSFDASEALPDFEGGAEAEASIDAAPVVPDDAAVVDAADASRPFCATVDASFCDDFESPQSGKSWDFESVVDGSVGIVEGGSPQSPGHALRGVAHAQVMVGDASGTFCQGLLTRNLLRGTSRGIAVDVDLRADDVPSAAEARIVSPLTVVLGSGNTQSALVVALSPNGGTLISGGPTLPDGGVFHPFVSPAAGAWYHLRIEADLIDGLVRVSVNGAAQGGSTPGPRSFDASYALTVGAYVTPAGPEARILVDNVVASPF